MFVNLNVKKLRMLSFTSLYSLLWLSVFCKVIQVITNYYYCMIIIIFRSDYNLLLFSKYNVSHAIRASQADMLHFELK